ncbi:MAG: BamA/TamA family outer membrane protein [Ignavibacteriales bacterium]|nr:MAG: BamA/TamA family outer membrane protein [Ignavibacteriales bacterium]
MFNKTLLFLLITFSFLSAQEDQYELNSISFNGQDKISQSTLAEIIYSQESPGWFWQFLNSFTPFGSGPIYFDSSNISTDLAALKSYYSANGFFESSFAYAYYVDTTDKRVDLEYSIFEGAQFTYNVINFHGLEPVPDSRVFYVWREFEFDSTQRFSQDVLQNGLSNSMLHLQNTGFMLARTDSVLVTQDTSLNKVDVDLYFHTGIRYIIDTLLIEKKGEGADLVENDLLKDITNINKGDYYSLENIRQSQYRLFRTGLFNSIVLSTSDENLYKDKIPLKLEGNIGPLHELSPEIIMNNQQNDFNVGLAASYIKKNFLGGARKLTVSTSFGVQDIFHINPGSLIKDFSFRDTTLLGFVDSRITIDQPFLFGKPIFGSWTNYATINKQRNFNNTIYGSKITMEFELPRFTFFNFLSAFYNVEVSNEVYRTLNDSLSIKLLSAIGADFGSTTIDNLLFPTQGYTLTFQVEEANSLPYLFAKLSGDDYDGALFYKIQVTNVNYINLSRNRNSVVALKSKVGYLHTFFGDYSGLPINRTFYLGGSNSLRGWRANELVPEGAPSVLGEFNQGVNVKGGTFVIEGSIEQRHKFTNEIGAALFVDLGNTWLSYKEFQFDRIAIAAGFGFRYYSPIAPFRIDFGLKLYDPADSKFIFNKNYWKNLEIQFGIGEAF